MLEIFHLPRRYDVERIAELSAMLDAVLADRRPIGPQLQEALQTGPAGSGLVVRHLVENHYARSPRAVRELDVATALRLIELVTVALRLGVALGREQAARAPRTA